MTERQQKHVVVVTGGGAGVGRATAEAFAQRGDDVAVIGRDQKRLDDAVWALRGHGVRAIGIAADVADADAVEAAADRIEEELGPITIWVNNAMVTVFSPVKHATAEDFRRVTEVTYLGTIHGTKAALKRMTRRDAGTIINVGSALAYRSVPLQAAYCGAKSAIRGFTDSLRSELIHDGLKIQLTMVHLPAVNTPQFDWAMNRTGRRAQPVPPIYQPEVPARAIVYASHAKRREVWVGYPTVQAILANRIAPNFADKYLAKFGYSSQMAAEKLAPNTPDNLEAPVRGGYAAHGRFDDKARTRSWEFFADQHRPIAFAAVAGTLLGLHLLARKLKI